MKVLIKLVGIFVIAIGNVYAVQIYTWVDKNGEKHFSQTPPVNQSEQKFKEKSINVNTRYKEPSKRENKATSVSAANDKNILRRGEVGQYDKLLAKKNPDRLFLVATPNFNTLIIKEEKRKGRKLTKNEIDKIRSKAKVKAVTSDELKEYR